ncbi:MAG: hypothetical protein GEU68_08540 [Actinobacteria bacterium]|nr:hypothetical protein [Actinomycetota bacterium]
MDGQEEEADRRRRGRSGGAGWGPGVGIASSTDDDQPIEGNSRRRATDAALEHVGRGTVIETEMGDDGAVHGVEIRLDDGNVLEVELDENFNVAEPSRTTTRTRSRAQATTDSHRGYPPEAG